MRNKLRVLLLLLVAMPAWAGGEMAGPAAGNAANIELKGAARSDGTLVALLSQQPAAKPGNISGALVERATSPKDDAPANVCPTGCTMMHCPPPGGPVICCNTANYQPC